jgi:hypothetical protein
LRRGNEFDVTSQVLTTDPAAVNAEVHRIYRELYPDDASVVIDQAFRDAAQLYRGEYPGYHACDTAYHDVQHVLDVTLAMARLISGYERGRQGGDRLDASLFRLGVITALFHDCGYVRRLDDVEHKNGAEMTLTHVSRGAEFLRDYLPGVGMGHMADIAASLIHFTGYEMPISQIKVPSLLYKQLGGLLGSADIIAQMADRCYLEKCRDRLYPEFVAGGLAHRRLSNGEVQIVYESGEDLVRKTPLFYKSASRRLEEDLGGTHRYAEHHFGGQHLYLEEVAKNVQFAESMQSEPDASSLRRKPPETLSERRDED